MIDAAPTASRHSKALVIHVRTLEVFERMGVVAAILAGAQPMLRMNVMGRERPVARVSIDSLPGRFPAPVVLEQSNTEAVLEARFTELGGHVERATRLVAYREDGDGVTATLSSDAGETSVAAAWLLGCDGAHSAVRHLAGVPFEGSQYDDTFDQADLHLRWDRPAGEGYFFFRESGGLVAFLPLPRGRYPVLFVTWDEAYSASNQVFAAFFGPGVRPGTSCAARLDHYSFCRLITDNFGKEPLENAAAAASISDIWDL